jgi:hypothetical protein
MLLGRIDRTSPGLLPITQQIRAYRRNEVGCRRHSNLGSGKEPGEFSVVELDHIACHTTAAGSICTKPRLWATLIASPRPVTFSSGRNFHKLRLCRHFKMGPTCRRGLKSGQSLARSESGIRCSRQNGPRCPARYFFEIEPQRREHSMSASCESCLRRLFGITDGMRPREDRVTAMP